jgi:3-methylfumaryl-CoA hydratase
MTAWEQWIGRSIEQHDRLTPAALARFRATIDSDASGDVAAQAIHWCLCLPDAPTGALGPDGHPLRQDDPGSFMPPIPLPRRMWAASDVRFLAPIAAGAAIARTSTIAAIKEKTGGTGPLVFVEVEHETRADDVVAVQERQTIVFRAPAPAATVSPAPAAAGEPDLSDWSWRHDVVPGEAMLFRYSALTFNSHRIHYDRDYVTQVEGYPGLVVHGPLTATLLVDLIRRSTPAARVDAFSFRAISPLFDGNAMSVNADPPGPDGRVRLWAANAEGGLAIAAEATLSGTVPS